MTVPVFDEAEDARDKAAEDKLEVLLTLLAEDELASEDVCGLVLVLLAVKPLPPSAGPLLPPPPQALKSDIASTAKKVGACGKGKLIIKTTYCMGLRLDRIGLKELASI